MLRVPIRKLDGLEGEQELHGENYWIMKALSLTFFVSQTHKIITILCVTQHMCFIHIHTHMTRQKVNTILVTV